MYTVSLSSKSKNDIVTDVAVGTITQDGTDDTCRALSATPDIDQYVPNL